MDGEDYTTLTIPRKLTEVSASASEALGNGPEGPFD